MRRWQLVLDYTGSVEGIYAIIYCTKWRSGQVSRIPYLMTTLKDSATQLLKKYKSGALVTQLKTSSRPTRADSSEAGAYKQGWQKISTLF